MGRYFLLAFVALMVVAVALNWKKVQTAWLAFKKFLREVRVEMQKVSWPSRNEVIGSTIIVLIAVVAMTVFVSSVDELLSRVLSIVLQ